MSKKKVSLFGADTFLFQKSLQVILYIEICLTIYSKITEGLPQKQGK
jgi:hypothetical protein